MEHGERGKGGGNSLPREKVRIYSCSLLHLARFVGSKNGLLDVVDLLPENQLEIVAGTVLFVKRCPARLVFMFAHYVEI
jgi:hypothetical protein